MAHSAASFPRGTRGVAGLPPPHNIRCRHMHSPSAAPSSRALARPNGALPAQRVRRGVNSARWSLFRGRSLASRVPPMLRPRREKERGSSTVRAVAEEVDFQGEAIAEDYYSVLGLKPYASQEEIKSAYYSCMKACHPDLSNNHPDSVDFCAFVNEIYEVLSDPEMRAVYDEIKGYSVSAVNPFYDTEAERDYAFVDEFTCIGCKNCANTAESTFAIEELWGRARVLNQRGDCPAKVQEAIDTCPVECIHWVSAAQLALLEDEMRRMERVSVGTMMAGQGAKGMDVFRQAIFRWERRRMAVEAKARVQAAKERRRQEAQGETPWGWGGGSPFWGAEGGAQDQKGSSEGAEDPGERKQRTRRQPNKERMAKAAEAARRWREYSQKGVDRRRRALALADKKWEDVEAADAGEGGSLSDLEGPEGAVSGPGLLEVTVPLRDTGVLTSEDGKKGALDELTSGAGRA